MSDNIVKVLRDAFVSKMAHCLCCELCLFHFATKKDVSFVLFPLSAF